MSDDVDGPDRPADPRDSVLDPRHGDPARLRAWLRLQEAHALSPSRVRESLQSHGDPARALREAGPPARRGPRPSRLDPDRALAALRRCGARGIALGSPLYPAGLADLEDPPLLLWVRGNPARLAAPAVALVGPRAPSAYGLGQAARLAAGVAARGVTVVSGLARGVDARAHDAALAAGGATVGVLACGIDRVYPPEHGPLARRVEASGALVSEMPPGTPPLAFLFPVRNRIISGLSRLVVVVEARPRSGSLVTARHALDQGVEVLAVPGPVDAPTSEGANRLIRDGAAPVLGPEDLLDRMSEALPVRPPDDPQRKASPTVADAPLSPEAADILRQLEREPADRDGLSLALGRPVASLARPLLELELEGRVVGDRDGRLRPRRPSGPRP